MCRCRHLALRRLGVLLTRCMIATAPGCKPSVIMHPVEAVLTLLPNLSAPFVFLEHSLSTRYQYECVGCSRSRLPYPSALRRELRYFLDLLSIALQTTPLIVGLAVSNALETALKAFNFQPVPSFLAFIFKTVLMVAFFFFLRKLTSGYLRIQRLIVCGLCSVQVLI